jgi:hypothetical protein
MDIILNNILVSIQLYTIIPHQEEYFFCFLGKLFILKLIIKKEQTNKFDIFISFLGKCITKNIQICILVFIILFLPRKNIKCCCFMSFLGKLKIKIQLFYDIHRQYMFIKI